MFVISTIFMVNAQYLCSVLSKSGVCVGTMCDGRWSVVVLRNQTESY